MTESSGPVIEILPAAAEIVDDERPRAGPQEATIPCHPQNRYS
jgi:hypothetical protein